MYISERQREGEKMDDTDIVALYWERSDRAIPETERKYGAYCTRIACNILGGRCDAEECVNTPI